MAVLDEIRTSIGGVAERVGPAVVGLRTGRHHGGGSGVVIGEGTVLTVAHALRGEEAEVQFAGGRRATARVAGVDADLGIAVLEADTGDVAPVDLADGDAPLGTPVVALADPGGRGLRVTLGFVTAAEGGFRTHRGRRVAAAIEHSAPLPRGSSGGPLVDLDGRLLGVNAARRDGGLILALAADAQLRERVERLGRGERIEPRRLGVAVAPPRLARRLRRAVGLPERDGLLVRAVQEGSPAERAGLEAGDLLVRAGERELDGLDALHAAIDTADALTLGVVRGLEEREVQVRLAGDGEEA
jgi:serine protease Do